MKGSGKEIRDTFAYDFKGSLLFFYLLLLGGVCNSQVQDKQLYGQFLVYNYPMDARTTDEINSQCFEGIGYINCRPQNLDTRESRDNAMPYYVSLLEIVDDYICLQCCGINDGVETWDLQCPITMVTALTYNKYGLVLHMGKRRFEGDREFVSCPLKRSACTYDENTGETLSCTNLDYLDDNTYLVGYTVTVDIIQYSEYMSYWVGVESCSIETIESSTPLIENDMFKEKIIMNRLKVPTTFDSFRITVLFFLLIFVLYPVCYYCRKAECSVCCKKLVFFIDRCPMCRFVGAYPPDPRLVTALESKSKYLQGEQPLEEYPGKSVVEHCCGRLFRFLCPYCHTYLFGSNDAKVAVSNSEDSNNEDEMKTTTENSKGFKDEEKGRQAWLDDIYNFIDPDPPPKKGGKNKVPKKALKIRALSKQKPEPEIVSSVQDREKLTKHFPDDYVLYRTIEHPYLPRQPVGLGKQGNDWREKESETTAMK